MNSWCLKPGRSLQHLMCFCEPHCSDRYSWFLLTCCLLTCCLLLQGFSCRCLMLQPGGQSCQWLLSFSCLCLWLLRAVMSCR